MKMLDTYKLKNMILKNRIVMAPMCIDGSDSTGKANHFHTIHYANRAIGGVGLIILEATSVSSDGRITERDLGIWEDSQIEGLSKTVSACKEHGSKVALQLAHSGRKCELKDFCPVAPSPIKFHDKFKLPLELSRTRIKEIINDFSEAAIRSEKAGFDALEIHAAHGYLIHEFLSPLTNKRVDEYGGSFENRVRFLKEILESVRKVWPVEKPIFLRISASDYCDGGINIDEMVKIINSIKDNIDIVHVSSGGLVIVPLDIYPGYQVKFSEIIKEKCSIPTIAVGLITMKEQVEEVLMNDRADLVSLGRELLRNPYWLLQTAYTSGFELDMPLQYKRAFNLLNKF